MGEKEQSGVQSVEIAGDVLRAIVDAGRAVPLGDVAKRAGIHPSKAHRYLVSLCRIGLVEQDGRGYYGAGPLAVPLGFSRLRNLDFVTCAAPSLAALCDETGETTLLSIWSERGPLVLRLEESARPVFLNVRTGSVLPLLQTAAGQVFAAYLDEQIVRAHLARELDGVPNRDKAARAFLAALPGLRRAGVAHVEGQLVPGVTAIAAPVFDANDQVVAAIGLLGRDADVDIAIDGKHVMALKIAASAISMKLGHRFDIADERM